MKWLIVLYLFVSGSLLAYLVPPPPHDRASIATAVLSLVGGILAVYSLFQAFSSPRSAEDLAADAAAKSVQQMERLNIARDRAADLTEQLRQTHVQNRELQRQLQMAEAEETEVRRRIQNTRRRTKYHAQNAPAAPPQSRPEDPQVPDDSSALDMLLADDDEAS